MDCIFCRIAAGTLPATHIYEDERCIAIRDVRPLAPIHVLVMPRVHVVSLWELDDAELAGALLVAAARVARAEGLEQGWRLIANTRGHAGQVVEHLHLHVLGGKKLGRMLPES